MLLIIHLNAFINTIVSSIFLSTPPWNVRFIHSVAMTSQAGLHPDWRAERLLLSSAWALLCHFKATGFKHPVLLSLSEGSFITVPWFWWTMPAGMRSWLGLLQVEQLHPCATSWLGMIDCFHSFELIHLEGCRFWHLWRFWHKNQSWKRFCHGPGSRRALNPGHGVIGPKDRPLGHAGDSLPGHPCQMFGRRGKLFQSFGLQRIHRSQRSKSTRLDLLRWASWENLLWAESHQTGQKLGAFKTSTCLYLHAYFCLKILRCPTQPLFMQRK